MNNTSWSCQNSGAIWRMHRQCIPGSFFSAYAKEPGDKAMIVPKVTCDLPLHSLPSNSTWNHISGVCLADSDFETPGCIDLLLGVETFADVMCNGWRYGAPGMPIAFEAYLGWVLAGSVVSPSYPAWVAVHCSILFSEDELLRQFWETKEKPLHHDSLTDEEHTVMGNFESHFSRLPDGW